LATLLCAFQRDQYKLPKDVLLWRWKLARARYGAAVPYAANEGLGLYDKFGARLPQFDLRAGKISRKNRRNAPTIPPKSASSIYLMRAGEIPVRLGGGCIGDFDFRRSRRAYHAPPALPYTSTSSPYDGDCQMSTKGQGPRFPEVLPVKLPIGAREALAKVAKSRFETACATARKAIMREIAESDVRIKEDAVA
jgi:hypothetical protein